jgi:hypothetical protein
LKGERHITQKQELRKKKNNTGNYPNTPPCRKPTENMRSIEKERDKDKEKRKKRKKEREG